MSENEVVRYDRQQLPIVSMADVSAMGQHIAQSGMFGVCSPGKGAVIAATCHQEGMSLLEFKRTFHVTDRGEISMRSDRMLAEFRQRGGSYKWTEFSATRAAAIWTYRDNEKIEIDYTIEQAQNAGLVRAKSAWTTDPAAMLRARLISKAVRMLCPEAIAGVYTPEELDDIRQSEPMQAAQVPVAKQPEPEIIEAETVADDGDPFDTPGMDYSVCPMRGKMYGVPWEDMPIKTLEAAITVEHPDMEEEHRKAVQAAINSAMKGIDNE